MKKIQMLGLALVAMFAFSAIIATVASAETTLLAEWLVAAKPVLVLTATEGTGELVLGDSKIGLKMTCSGILDGSVGPNGEDEITEVLNLSKVAATLAKPLVCTPGTGCAAPAEAAPENLPWHTTLFLTEAGTFRDLVEKATYWSMCNILGFLSEEECTVTNGTYEVLNVVGGVEAMGEITPLGSCTVGGAAAGSQTFIAGNLLTSSAGALTVSSE